jgi:hypothetical protein
MDRRRRHPGGGDVADRNPPEGSAGLTSVSR